MDKIYVLKRAAGLDPDGQPLNRAFSAKRLCERSTDELIGICRGLIVDGLVSEEEVLFLKRWAEANRTTMQAWPSNVIMARIDKILEDGIIDQEERVDLFGLLGEIVGHARRPDAPTQLPFTKPAPPVFFRDHRFCLTGRFAWGTRRECADEILSRGGQLQDNVSGDVHFVIVGEFASTDWIHSTFGRKIQYAASLADKGMPIAIISEEHWVDHLL